MSQPLDGRWLLLKAEFGGESAPQEITEQTELFFAESSYEVRFGGAMVDRGTFERDDAGAVRTLVLRGVAGTNAGRTLPAIYQHVGDRLRVCYGLDGHTPEDFATAPGQRRYLATYRRVPV